MAGRGILLNEARVRVNKPAAWRDACGGDRLFVAIQSELSPIGSSRRDGARRTWLQWTAKLEDKVHYRFFVQASGADLSSELVHRLEVERLHYGDIVVNSQDALKSALSWNAELWSLQWIQSSEFQNFSVFLALSDDSLLCIHRVVAELARRPSERFVWGRFSCAQRSLDAPRSLVDAPPQLEKGFLAVTRDVAQLLTKFLLANADGQHGEIDVNTFLLFFDLTILDDQNRLVGESQAREWLEEHVDDAGGTFHRDNQRHFCQNFVWAGGLGDKQLHGNSRNHTHPQLLLWSVGGFESEGSIGRASDRFRTLENAHDRLSMNSSSNASVRNARIPSGGTPRVEVLPSHISTLAVNRSTINTTEFKDPRTYMYNTLHVAALPLHSTEESGNDVTKKEVGESRRDIVREDASLQLDASWLALNANPSRSTQRRKLLRASPEASEAKWSKETRAANLAKGHTRGRRSKQSSRSLDAPHNEDGGRPMTTMTSTRVGSSRTRVRTVGSEKPMYERSNPVQDAKSTTSNMMAAKAARETRVGIQRVYSNGFLDATRNYVNSLHRNRNAEP